MSALREKAPVQTDLLRLRGVGPQMVKLFARLNIHCVQDLLLHLPARYQDRSKVTPMRQLVAGREAVVEGEIHSVGQPKRTKTKLLCELRDDSGYVLLRFFHVHSFQKDQLKKGVRVRCYGDVRFGPKGFEMAHPEFKVISEEYPLPTEKHLTPIYPATDGLSQHMLRKITSAALTYLNQPSMFKELLPESVLATLSMRTLKESIRFLHRPPCDTPINELMAVETPAQQRLVFEELLAHRLSMLRVKESFQRHSSVALTEGVKWQENFSTSLPFELTGAQKRTVKEINQDLQQAKPMLRLVQGDVGSGKTIVAAMAMLNAHASGYQSVMMAPTELLAEQHYRNFKAWLEPLGLTVICLTGSMKTKERKEALEKVTSGAAHVVLGTHALFQSGVEFHKLALVVIDEQHRFGVEQRAMLRDKAAGENVFPHQLIMTATPIPRTLSMSFYADLDISVIDELPPGRTPVATTVISNSRRDEVVARIEDACASGRQVYWVCPLIEESEVLDCQAATTLSEQLSKWLPNIKIALIHGRMSPQEKDDIMRAFKNNETQILVATTVIEVGVDVPNASVMVIENAERLGLSQLHQLRGRVGRGAVASNCVLMYQHPLSRMAKERLAVMRDTNDGFKIAQRDLELRGPGEVLGTKQTGDMSFRIADLLRDNELLPHVQRAANDILANHPQYVELIMQRWLGQRIGYAKV